ncbi:flagellar cap protein FliD N-terminal domain-containing protein [Treponema pallidum]|uniref:flagellar cap protein FliD N-terminal domain-containing protein n=1 Tax=Treponema pallidum TaxID=160 RepID=UPI000A990D3C|nr:flagellar cap protein FliD N-terminal domain-containing protein [Treponema pallidum]
MSDVRIPGVGAGKYDNLIQSLMKKERIPRDNAAAKVKVYEVQNNALKDVERYARDLRDAVKGLYSFNNPFAEKEAHSSNERAFTVDATRDAAEQNHTLRVKDIAQGDAFLSDPLPEDFRVPSGTYTFCIGEKKYACRGKAGTIVILYVPSTSRAKTHSPSQR